jgi:3-hydroxy-9,10-secoandrosta-1,3,5(10)-triene-9,17-dione monooxygenase
MSNIPERLHDLADKFESLADEAERLGKLPDATVALLRDSGVIRMLQPREFGGFESHPVDFFKAIMEISAHDPAAGWVAGVVGVHPHELAQGTLKMQGEIWSADPDTWVGSPYMPGGRAVPVEGGYRFNGHWQFSSGTDHCSWVMIGGLVVDADGTVTDPDVHHFVLPRSDYEIVEGSWDVFGLLGTGSKDLIVRDAFVPAHRVIKTGEITAGTGGLAAGRPEPLYAMPRNVMFSGAIVAATIGIVEGALAAYIAQTRERQTRGTKASLDPTHLQALGAAAADIDASVQQFLGDIGQVFDLVSTGAVATLDVRARVRRNQVQASNRAVRALDEVFRLSGGSALHRNQPLQRFWRDAQAAVHHASNVAGPVFQHYGLQLFGHPLPREARL